MSMALPDRSVIASLAGSFLLGSFLNVFLAGINWMQVFNFFTTAKNEKPIYVWMVAIVGFLGIVHSVFAVIIEYHDLVTKYGDFPTLLHIHWTYCLDPVLTAIVAAIVQTFYAYRVYILSGRRRVLPAFILFLTLVQLGLGSFTSIYALMHPSWAYVGAHISWAVSSWLFVMAGTDIIITGTIVWFLARTRSNFEGTNSIIDGVIKYTITNNGLTSAAAITSALMFEEGPGLWHIIPGTIIIKLYSISLLASLNARRGLAQDLMASRHGPTLARGTSGSPKGLNSHQNIFSNSHSPALRSPSTLHFKDIPIRNGGLSSGRASKAPSMREHGDASFPVQVTIDTTSSEFRAEDLDWEERSRKPQKIDSIATTNRNPSTWSSHTGSNPSPPFQLFVDEP